MRIGQLEGLLSDAEEAVTPWRRKYKGLKDAAAIVERQRAATAEEVQGLARQMAGVECQLGVAVEEGNKARRQVGRASYSLITTISRLLSILIYTTLAVLFTCCCSSDAVPRWLTSRTSWQMPIPPLRTLSRRGTWSAPVCRCVQGCIFPIDQPLISFGLISLEDCCSYFIPLDYVILFQL